MSSNLPLVSICCLCYNTGQYVLKALNSVLEQGYPNLEIITIDDCSPDKESITLLKNWINTHSNKEGLKIKTLFRTENKGVHAGLNDFFAMASGKYMAFCSDDVLAQNRLSGQVAHMEALGEEYALYFGNIIMIDKDDQILAEEQQNISLPKDLSNFCGDAFLHTARDHWFWVQTCLVRTSCLKAINFVADKEFISEDWHLTLSLTRHYKICGEEKLAAYYRYLDTSITRTNWQGEKFSWVQLSHAKMLLSFLGHPKNTDIEEEALLKRAYESLLRIDLRIRGIKKLVTKELFGMIQKGKHKRLSIKYSLKYIYDAVINKR